VTNADLKGLTTISKDVKELSSRAQLGKLLPHEFQGGSFSISNLGMFDVDEFCGVINPPQVAILAVGKGKKTVGIDDTGKPCTTVVMKVTLSCDQRVVDTETGAKLLNSIKNYIQTPHLLIGIPLSSHATLKTEDEHGILGKSIKQ